MLSIPRQLAPSAVVCAVEVCHSNVTYAVLVVGGVTFSRLLQQRHNLILVLRFAWSSSRLLRALYLGQFVVFRIFIFIFPWTNREGYQQAKSGVARKLLDKCNPIFANYVEFRTTGIANYGPWAERKSWKVATRNCLVENQVEMWPFLEPSGA